ncbi:MAG TPA: ABC transporter permease [Acidimicrobiales bacterium]|jgi:ABC-type multidrug transport system permease subunit|nr:ABC transporter permease [Acidimicrobiales bacterium]
MTTIAAPRPGASYPVAVVTVGVRAARKFIRTPALLLGGTVSGVMFLLIFRYVFGGAVAHIGTMTYVDFLAPGFIVTSTIFSAMNSGTGMAEDLQEGLVDRLRSLPISGSAIVFGRVLADTLMAGWGLALTAGCSFAVGLRLHNGVGPALGAFGLSLLFAMAFCWLFTALGFFSGSAQAAQSLAFLVFPLSFVSSAYVPVKTMPGWMQAFAANQPVTPMVNTARILTEGHAAVAALGHPLSAYLPAALLWTAGIMAATVPLCAWKLRRA